MSSVRSRGEDVRRYILNNIEKHPTDISAVTAKHFSITRQAVNKHLLRLVEEKCLSVTGKTRNKTYSIVPLSHWSQAYPISKKTEEDVIWRLDIQPQLGHLPANVQNIWHYGFTEIFNNAIDHSAGQTITVAIIKTAANTTLLIWDDGVGIFRKIQGELDLLDVRHAVFELAKGKLTTDPKNHTGEGIFFSSRMFDTFIIVSDGASFSHEFDDPEDWVIENQREKGTMVQMKLNNHTARTTKKIFDQFAIGDEFGFNKTVVPVKLAQYGAETMVSRSQAKRLLARVELFKTVVFDFKDVVTIGQAFADEIFRVFANRHPEIELIALHANSEVKQMIERAKSVRLNEAD